jgi:lambda family phage tail tape measure protein
MLIIAPILQFIKGLLSPRPGALEGVNALKTAIPGFALSANGNVFAQNGIQKFARGGVVSRPTMFPFANGIGLMGEAGPEAIMPLKRGRDGRLGVAGGGGVNVGEINISVQNTGESLSPAAQKQLAGQVRGIVLATLVNEQRGGGVLR